MSMAREQEVAVVCPRPKGCDVDEEAQVESKVESSASDFIDEGQEILAVLDLDPALSKKMHLVNNVSSDRDDDASLGRQVGNVLG